MATAQYVLAVARHEIGYHEGPNDGTPYGIWYGLNHVKWCDMFVSWVGYHAGAGDIIGKSALCRSHAVWFKKRGQWGTTPELGALIFFHWPEEASPVNHVGIVEAVEANVVVTIEGNCSAAVRRVRRNRGSSTIVGYGYPAYDNQSAHRLSTSTRSYPWASPNSSSC